MDGSPYPACTETLRDMNLVGNCLLYMTRNGFVSFVKSHKESEGSKNVILGTDL